MKKHLKELFWVGLILVLTFIVYCFTFDGIGLVVNDTNTALLPEITFHYSSFSIILGYISIIGFMIYLVRVLVTRFGHMSVNIIFMITNAIAIVVNTCIIALNEQYSIEEGLTIYPPLSAAPQKIEEKIWFIDTHYLLMIQLLLIAGIAYTAYRTGTLRRKI